MQLWLLPEEEEQNPSPLSSHGVKKGDVWQLGRHFLMCGDSTNPLDVRQLMQGNQAALVIADPPYGMGKAGQGVTNDNLYRDNLIEFNKQWIPLTFDFMTSNGSWYCWGMNGPLMNIYSFIIYPMEKEKQVSFRNLIVWDKGGVNGQNSPLMRSYPSSDEKCLFVVKGRAMPSRGDTQEDFCEAFEPIRSYLEQEAKKIKLNNAILKELCGTSSMYSHWFSRSQWALIPEHHYLAIQQYARDNSIEAFLTDYSTITEEAGKLDRTSAVIFPYFDNVHDNMNTVWKFDRVQGKEKAETGGHPTPKPLAIISRIIKSSSKPNDLILDPFGGSGTTLIACEFLNRSCYMMEHETSWCEVILSRWEKYTKQKAFLVHPM